MTREEVKEEHRRRIAERERTRDALQKRDRAISNARLLVFVLFAGVGVAAYAVPAVRALWLLVPLSIFVVLVAMHERAIRARERADRALAFWRRGLLRVEEKWRGEGDDGARFHSDQHPYASDLDLFGEGSVFQRMQVARTSWGAATLARWLTEPAVPDEARARQGAVRELAALPDLREELAVMGDDLAEEDEQRGGTLRRWAADRVELPAVVLWLVPPFVLASTVALVLWWRDDVPWWGACLVLAAQATFAFALRGRVLTVLSGAAEARRELGTLAASLLVLERAPFEDPYLAGLTERARVEGLLASEEIERLSRHTERLEQAANQFFAPFAALLMWKTLHAFALERWRRRAGPHVPVWLDVTGDLEALLSLAGYCYERPDDVFPTLADGPPRVVGEALGHPLLADGGVRNDVSLGEPAGLWLVSGSNMSGKSTWLRTVGLNVVLAQAGAPVCARSLTLTPLSVGGTLRVEDDLGRGASRFFAEVTRLKQLFDLADPERPLLFLIDELLSGTNSHDRRIGAEAVLTGLLDRSAIGLATTHDLALTDIAAALQPRAANVHFADVLRDGELVFDYSLKQGVVQRSNALDVMKAVGLPL